MSIFEELEKKSNELAKKHCEIIESNCKEMCQKYDIKPEQLCLFYKPDGTIEMYIKCLELKITSEFTYGNT